MKNEIPKEAQVILFFTQAILGRGIRTHDFRYRINFFNHLSYKPLVEAHVIKSMVLERMKRKAVSSNSIYLFNKEKEEDEIHEITMQEETSFSRIRNP